MQLTEVQRQIATCDTGRAVTAAGTPPGPSIPPPASSCATYDVQIIDDSCSTANEDSYSTALPVVMSASGDIVGDCGPRPCTAPQGVVDFVDISACVEKFRNLPDSVRKARADVVNSDIAQPLPDRKIDFVDISCVVGAFRGTPCALPGPPATDPCQ